MTNFVTRLRLTSRPSWIAAILHLLAALWLILTPLLPLLLARAQRPSDSITLLDVTARAVSNTTLVTVTADGSLSHAQTWEDQEGYHVIIPGGRPSEALKQGRGYKVRRSGSAVEVLLFTKRGTPVQLRTDNKSINLSVSGALDNDDSASSVVSSQGYSLPDYGKSSNTSPARTSPSDETSSPMEKELNKRSLTFLLTKNGLNLYLRIPIYSVRCCRRKCDLQ